MCAVQGEPFNELVDTVITRLMPQQPEWSSDMVPALLDCLLNKAPNEDSQGKGVPGLTRLVEHLRNNTKSFYCHLLNTIAYGSPAALTAGIELLLAQWPAESDFASKSGSTLCEYCECGRLDLHCADCVSMS